jgi:anthraniloyl-CoA monooxygenase
MGQTVWESRPDYRRLFAVPASDRIRNEAGIPTIAAGNITTADDVNTILAAGRADLCLLELPASS